MNTWVTPNHLTTLRLLIGLAGALCLAHGEFAWANAGALLIVLSNFVDHTDGELARIGGKSSRIGHFYDLACDALVTVMLFVGMGVGAGATHIAGLKIAPGVLGAVAGVAIALISSCACASRRWPARRARSRHQSAVSKRKTSCICYRSSR
ncbi:CDP-alcohol phosphatidyltransferase family protein [Paraburkholderia dipogonis]|uniref:CDP-alcohol phosphatidyltransferase family protein n=1 Tax=Paraburkholderia dipogonis TaxID=1211383 RepID=UPI0035E50160